MDGNDMTWRSVIMVRKIITIDEDLCNGCGLCANACHEGAIGIIDGKAKLLRDDYCDGLGNCLPACPTGAISFVEREALEYNEGEVKKNMENKKANENKAAEPLACGCPGTQSRSLVRDNAGTKPKLVQMTEQESELRQWPVQIKLAPIRAPYFDGAKLLIAADCTAYAYANFHRDFIKNKITLIGCPKLDEGDYSEKLTAIIKNNDIKSVTIVRMEVPCCGGLEYAAKQAIMNSGKMIPWQVAVVSTDGQILED
jgi:ferredoxin